MMRFLGGVVSALLLVAAGFFLWTGMAHDGAAPTLPGLPAALVGAAAAGDDAPADPPAASDKTREEKRFSRYDHNRDAAVDRDEYLAARRKAFAKLDLDHNGSLSFDEYAAKTIAKFTGADADKSGRLDATEFATTRVVRKSQPRCPPTRPAASGDDDG